MATVYVKSPPITAMAAGASETIVEGLRLVRSDKITYTTTSPAAIFSLAPGTIVVGVLIEVDTAFASTVGDERIKIGDTSVNDRLADFGTAYLSIASSHLALKPYEYDNGGDIFATISGTSLSAGSATIWLLVRGGSNRRQ